MATVFTIFFMAIVFTIFFHAQPVIEYCKPVGDDSQAKAQNYRTCIRFEHECRDHNNCRKKGDYIQVFFHEFLDEVNQVPIQSSAELTGYNIGDRFIFLLNNDLPHFL
jgi:hypothetical protein